MYWTRGKEIERITSKTEKGRLDWKKIFELDKNILGDRKEETWASKRMPGETNKEDDTVAEMYPEAYRKSYQNIYDCQNSWKVK